MSRASPAAAHVAIDLDPIPSSSGTKRPPTYPPHLASPRNNSVDWDLIAPDQHTSSRRSTSSTRDPSVGRSNTSHHSSPTLRGSDDEDDVVAWDAATIAKGKQRAEEAYGEVEGAELESLHGSPMLRGGSFASDEPRRAPKGQRTEAATRAQRRRRLLVYGSIVGVVVLLLAAGRRRVPKDWKMERWKSESSAEVYGSGGNGSLIRTEDGTEFTYINNL